MVWKRIMNRHKKSKADTGNLLTCDLMEQYLRGLTLDLNLKLLCERQTLDFGPAKADVGSVGELFFAERMLWVDNITVTAYEAAPYGSRKNHGRRASGSRGYNSQIPQKIRDFLRIVWQIGQQPYP